MSKLLQIWNRSLYGAILAGGLVVSADARAYSHGMSEEEQIRFCANYAFENQNLQRVVREVGCVFPPSPRLTDNWTQRFDWCKAQLHRDAGIYLAFFNEPKGYYNVDNEWNTTRVMINQCKALSRENDEPNKRAACEDYANDAVRVATQFVSNSCVGAPEVAGRYSLSKEEHFNWCLHTASREGRDAERNARNADVRQCTKGPQCTEYAQDAVKVAKEYKRYGCKENPVYAGRYSVDEGEHYRWCVHSASPEGLVNERNGRYADLNQCNPALQKADAKPMPMFPKRTVWPDAVLNPPRLTPEAILNRPRATADAIVIPPRLTPDAIKLPAYPKPSIPPEAGERAKEVIERGAEAGRKVVEYGKEHAVHLRRRAYVAKEKLKESLQQLTKPQLRRAAYDAKLKIKDRLSGRRPSLGGASTKLSGLARLVKRR